MELKQTDTQLDIRYDNPGPVSAGPWFIGLGAVTLLLIPLMRFKPGDGGPLFVEIAAVVAILAGAIALWTAYTQHTVIQKDRIKIAKKRRLGGAISTQVIDTAQVERVEYAEIEINTGDNWMTYAIVYLNLTDGSRPKLGSRPMKKTLFSTKPFGPLHDEAMAIAAFLGVPLDDNPDTLRPIDT